MQTDIKKYEDFLYTNKLKRELLSKNIATAEANTVVYSEKAANFIEARDIFSIVGTLVQQETKSVIQDLVTLALSSVFGPEYAFELEDKISRNKPETYMHIVINGEKYSMEDDLGGGIVDVTSFALRVVLWALTTPRTAATIILDEPGKFISKDKLSLFGTMIQTLADMLEIQFIIVTHEDQLVETTEIGYIVKQTDGISAVESIYK